MITNNTAENSSRSNLDKGFGRMGSRVHENCGHCSRSVTPPGSGSMDKHQLFHRILILLSSCRYSLKGCIISLDTNNITSIQIYSIFVTQRTLQETNYLISEAPHIPQVSKHGGTKKTIIKKPIAEKLIFTLAFHLKIHLSQKCCYKKQLCLLGKEKINIKTPLSKDYEVFNLNA